MKKEDLEKKFRCGKIEASYENSRWYAFFIRILFLAVGIYFFWLMLGESHLIEHLDNWAVLAFCFWRIHRQGDTMCYLTEKGLLVRRQYRSPGEFFADFLHEDKNFVFLPYKDIYVIADDWREIQLGRAEEGGLVVLPVRLQFLSRKNKQRILDRVKKEAEEKEDD